jgi:hypothetical protein
MGSELDGLPMVLFNGSFIQRDILEKAVRAAAPAGRSCCSRTPSASSGKPRSRRVRRNALAARGARRRWCHFWFEPKETPLRRVLARRNCPSAKANRALVDLATKLSRPAPRLPEGPMQDGKLSQVPDRCAAALASAPRARRIPIARSPSHRSVPARRRHRPSGPASSLPTLKYMGGGAKIVIMNKGGAGGDIGAAEIARSKPDGYTIGFMNVPNTMMKSHERPTSWNVGSFLPIANLVFDPAVFAVLPNSKYKTMADVAAEAKKRPGEVSISSAGAGSNTHLDLIAFEDAAKGEAPCTSARTKGGQRTALLAPRRDRRERPGRRAGSSTKDDRALAIGSKARSPASTS